MLVKLESSANLTEALEKAARINNVLELDKIIKDLNSFDFPDHKSLMKAIKIRIDDLDPFDPHSVIEYILENLSPELKNLMNPARMILLSNSKPKLFGCFQGIRTSLQREQS